VRAGARFCAYCGRPVVAAFPSIPVSSGATCPACALVNRAGAKFCVRCGTSLVVASAPPVVIEAPPPQQRYPKPVVVFKVNGE